MFLPSPDLPALAPQTKACEKHKQPTKTVNKITIGQNAKGNNQTDIIRVRGCIWPVVKWAFINFKSVACEARYMRVSRCSKICQEGKVLTLVWLFQKCASKITGYKDCRILSNSSSELKNRIDSSAKRIPILLFMSAKANLTLSLFFVLESASFFSSKRRFVRSV